MLPQLTRALLIPVSRLAFRPTIEGRENVPRQGPVIMAANHLSFIDSFVVPLMAPRLVQFLAKDDYFTRPGAKGWLTRTTLEGVGAISVPRGAHRAAQDSLEVALDLLRTGGGFGIHPEGSRSRDGRLYRGRTGVAWLAFASGAPVVPVALIGTDRVQPIGAPFPHPHRVTVRFGKPLTFSPPQGSPGKARRAATDEIMDAIAALSGQERADEYNQLSST